MNNAWVLKAPVRRGCAVSECIRAAAKEGQWLGWGVKTTRQKSANTLHKGCVSLHVCADLYGRRHRSIGCVCMCVCVTANFTSLSSQLSRQYLFALSYLLCVNTEEMEPGEDAGVIKLPLVFQPFSSACILERKRRGFELM